MGIVNSWRTVTVWTADGELHPEADYGTRLVTRFEQMGKDVVRQPLTQVTGDEALESDVHVLTGGSTSVTNRTTWMPAAFKLVDRMIQDAKNEASYLLGICLGSQIIAERLAPGSVIAGDRIYAGLIDSQWAASRHHSHGVSVLPSFHYEQIDESVLERSGAQVIASSEAVPVLAFTNGPHIGATQLHPELTLEDVSALINFNAETIRSNGGHVAGSQAHTDTLSDRWTQDAFEHVLARLFIPENG